MLVIHVHVHVSKAVFDYMHHDVHHLMFHKGVTCSMKALWSTRYMYKL